MEYRKLGRTGLRASVIGFGAEWIGKMEQAEVNAMAARGAAAGVNIVDCWMSDPAVRSALGEALEPTRDQWIIQGHIGSTWQDGQYVRTRELDQVRPAFEDLLARLHTDHVELGMIHYVDACDEFRAIMNGPFIAYVRELLAAGKIGHVGLSTHNPEVALLACDEPEIEVVMFSLNPAFDMLPASEDINDLFGDYENVAGDGIEPVRARLYAKAEQTETALTVMKGYAGGRLLSADASPFGVALTPVQCIHYCLTRPAVASVLSGYKTVAEVQDALAYENATDSERDFAATIAAAPERRAYFGQCTYCGHCQPCVVGIDIATVNKFADLALAQDEVPTGIREHYLALDKNASDCIGCGSCEPNCPFGVRIVERMEETAKLFA